MKDDLRAAKGIWLAAFLGLVFYLLAFSALALDLNLYGLSYHSDREEARDFNEFNMGAGLRQDFWKSQRGTWFAEAGIYNDSLDTWAKYGGVGYQFYLGRFGVGGLLGVAHSPSYNDGETFIAPIPIVSFRLNDRIRIHSTFIPADIAEKGGNVFAVYLGVGLF